MLGALGLVLIAGAVAALVVVIASRGDPGTTKQEYVAKVEAICRRYNARLAKIPSPLALGNPKAVAQSIEQALPLVVERAERARSIEPPPELTDEVRRIFALSSKAIDDLRAALRSARHADVRASARAMGRFLLASDEARTASRAIGLSC